MNDILRGTLCFKGEKGKDGAIQYTAGTNIEITEDNVINVKVPEILNIICPIGKVEVFFDNEEHNSYLGFTWERINIEETDNANELIAFWKRIA